MGLKRYDERWFPLDLFFLGGGGVTGDVTKEKKRKVQIRCFCFGVFSPCCESFVFGIRIAELLFLSKICDVMIQQC